MTFKSRLFQKDSRKSSLNLNNNILYCIRKLCKENPITLTELKEEYDRFFKDKISLKPQEIIVAAIRALEAEIFAVKVYTVVDNREMTDLLLGLRGGPYASKMVDEDTPSLSKQRLLNLIKEHSTLGIHVKDLEDRYILVFRSKPSYLPFKTLKELLHRIPEVELASSGKTLRVRIRPAPPPPLRRSITKIPSMNRNSFVTSSLRQPKKNHDIMSMSVCRPSDLGFTRNNNDKMTTSVYIPSTKTGLLTPPSSAGSPDGSPDMTDLMSSFTRRHRIEEKSIDDVKKQNREILATLIRGVPGDGISLKSLTDEFNNIVGSASLNGSSLVEILRRDFADVVKVDDETDRNGPRVYQLNSPMLPRRTVADVYTKLALQSNRKPSDRVLKILRDIYKKKDVDKTPIQITVKDSPVERTQQDALVKELQMKLTPITQSPPEVRKRTNDEIFEIMKNRLKQGPVDYPSEFEELTKEAVNDTQSVLVQMMSSLNLCLKPLNGKMVLQVA